MKYQKAKKKVLRQIKIEQQRIRKSMFNPLPLTYNDKLFAILYKETDFIRRKAICNEIALNTKIIRGGDKHE